MGRYGNSSNRPPSHAWSRDWIIVLILGAFLVCIIAQLFNIQVVKGAEYSELAASAHTTNVTLSPRRGTMYDRNGEVIASNVDVKTIYVNPKEVKDPAQLARILETVLGPTTSKTYADYFQLVSQTDLSFAYVLRKADLELVEELKKRLEREGAEGIHYLDDTKRVYPNGELGSQVIGTVDIDGKGIAGLEMQYNELLNGKEGALIVERGRNDMPISNGENVRENAVDGIDIVTSIDISLQRRCEEALVSVIEEHEAKGGSVAVLDAATGEIYAACSFTRKTDEEFEAEWSAANKQALEDMEQRKIAKEAEAKEEKLKTPISEQQQEDESDLTEKKEGESQEDAAKKDENDLIDEGIYLEEVSRYKLEPGKLSTITDVYEPGSTFKPFTVLSVLSKTDGLGPDSTYTVPFALEVYDTTITDSHEHDTEDMSLTKILADSSNTGITIFSREVERKDLYETYKDLGLGFRSGVDFPGDAAGKLERSEDWDGVQGATVTFGQGLTITGMQLLRAYGAIEQLGVARTPHFLIDVPNDQEKAAELLEPLTKSEKVADPEVCLTIGDMLTEVVIDGTGEEAAIEGFTVTGKTGTAEVASVYGGYEENAYIMSFCGWLFGSSSDLVCLVTVDRPLWGKGGGDVCGPVFADIMSFAAERYQVDANAD